MTVCFTRLKIEMFAMHFPRKMKESNPFDSIVYIISKAEITEHFYCSNFKISSQVSGFNYSW